MCIVLAEGLLSKIVIDLGEDPVRLVNALRYKLGRLLVL